MKFFLISDNIDTQMGMRLAGIESAIVHEKEEVRQALEKALGDSSIGIILITEKLVELCREMIYDVKLNRRQPLILEIPDRHATSQITANMAKYVQEAIGLKL